MVHVKDSAGPPDHRIVEVGAGKIDFKKIFAQSDQAGIKYYFVEHDEPADAFASIRASCEYLKRLEFCWTGERRGRALGALASAPAPRGGVCPGPRPPSGRTTWTVALRSFA